jgi:uncharacterized membrane protein
MWEESEMKMNSKSMDMTRRSSPTTLAVLGIMCAILSIFVTAEIGSIAVILGAYAWKKYPDSSLGLIILVIGLISMIASFEVFGPISLYLVPY